jgi:hypothetical protein
MSQPPPEPDPEGPTAPPQRRGPRTAADPRYKYIGRAKGQFRARPYCSITGQRHYLGLFPTREAARRAILEFWWSQREGRSKFVREVRQRDGTVRYQTRVTLDLGKFPTQAEAERVRDELITMLCSDKAALILARYELSSRGATPKPDDPDGA